MDSDKKQIIVDEECEAERKRSAHTTARCLLGGLCVLLLAAVSIGAVMITLKLLRDTTVTYEVQFGNTETVAVADVADNTVEYHVTDDEQDEPVWTLTNFNRALEIFKVRNAGGELVCYVTPLNVEESPTPDEVITLPIADDLNPPIITRHMLVVSTPLRDKSVLGSKGEAMCSDVDVYWIIPECLQSEQGVSIGQAARDVMMTYVVRESDLESDIGNKRKRREANEFGIHATHLVHREHNPIHVQSASVFRSLGRYRDPQQQQRRRPVEPRSRQA